jgi:hypothetical protein
MHSKAGVIAPAFRWFQSRLSFGSHMLDFLTDFAGSIAEEAFMKALWNLAHSYQRRPEPTSPSAPSDYEVGRAQAAERFAKIKFLNETTHSSETPSGISTSGL